MSFNPGYPNGQMPPTTLTNWGGNTIYTGMLGACQQLNLRAIQDGYTLAVAPPVGGYRSLATQADMLTHPGRYGLNPNSNAPLAPIGKSTHGWGTAVDFIGAPITWLHTNAPDYGFSFPLAIEGDTNHAEWNGTIFASTTETPIDNTTEQDDEMVKLNYIYVPELHNSIIGYAPGIVTAGTTDMWNQRCVNWGIPAPAPLPPRVPYEYYLSFLHLETGFPIGNINLDVTPQWVG